MAPTPARAQDSLHSRRRIPARAGRDTPIKNLHDGGIFFHRLARQQLLDVWAGWDKAGLRDHFLSWDGSFVPRLVRGTTSTLSNHAFGTAFDINEPFNVMGTMPALVGRKGSVRELVKIANDNGFWWGGHFAKRKDGMHFEVAEVR